MRYRPCARKGPPPLLLALGLSLSLLAATSGPLLGQNTQRVVSGTVIDNRTQRPVPGAAVTVDGTDLGALTDNRGRFNLAGAGDGTVSVTVVRLGYREMSLTVPPGTASLMVSLTPLPILLDEIVVTGTAGRATARSLGNAVGIVDAVAREIIAPSPNVQRMISTQVPGVRILSTGGEVGTGGVARIRGASSFSLSGTPLLYVDGIRVNGADGVPGVGFDPLRSPSRINDFNPEDIESIEIIKGPAATTLYGTEASNGVIQIITKRGRQGAPTVEFYVKQGANFLPDPVSLFPRTWRQEGGLFTGGEIVPVNVLQNDLDRGFGSPFRTGHVQSYGANVSGGSDDVRYYMSAGFDRDEGPVVYNWQNKLSGRANISYTPSAAFNLDFSLGLVRSRTQSGTPQQPVSTSILYSCPFSSCEPGSGPQALDGEFRGYFGRTPESFIEDVEAFEEMDRTTFSLGGTHNASEWFMQRLTVGGDFGNARQSSLWRANNSPGSDFPLGRKEVANVRTTYVTVDYQATATFDATSDVQLATTGGAQFYRRQQQGNLSLGEFFPVDGLGTVSSGSQRSAEENFLENRTFGVFVQEQVSWKNRVFLTGAVRGDDNSAFGRDFDFQVYPKLSGSWVISEEPFFERVPLFDQVKLRAAWGKAGQQPDFFAALQTYRPAVGRGGVSIVTPDNLGNPKLEPEVGSEIEFGFDASLWDGRVGLEFTRYDQRRNNAIVPVPAQPSLGFPGLQFLNVGSIKNSGIEIGIHARAFETDDVALDLSLTYATARNEILSLGGQPPLVSDVRIGTFHVEGMPLSGIYHRRVVSADIIEVFPGFNAADPATVMCEGGDIIAGTTNLSLGGGAPVSCDTAPSVFWGQPIPEWEGSASATVTLFQNLQIFGLVDFVGGHNIVAGDLVGNHLFRLNSRAILERNDPILLGYEEIREIWPTGIMNAGWAKFRNLSVTYTVPGDLAGRIGASRMSLTVAGENLGTLWRAESKKFGLRWMDSELVDQVEPDGTPGLSAYSQEGWPQTRRYTVSLRITM